jgi:hypothetical protein
MKDKTNISLTIKILHLGQGSFTRKVRTIFTLKIIISIFVKLFLILVLHLRQFFIARLFVKRAKGIENPMKVQTEPHETLCRKIFCFVIAGYQSAILWFFLRVPWLLVRDYAYSLGFIYFCIVHKVYILLCQGLLCTLSMYIGALSCLMLL